MENFKIKVNSEAESKEAQELFFELGGDFYFGGKIYCNTHLGLVTINKDGLMANIELDGFEYKELTIQQLQDLVVLKLNDVKDATHIGINNKYYLGANCRYVMSNGKWCITDQDFSELKPIKKEMKIKEYLEKQADGSYELVLAYRKEGSDWIEVPEVATFYAEDSNMRVKGNYFFRLRSDDFNDEAIYLNNNWMRASFDVRNMTVLWQRSTQPEELPFIDDEPKSLNDQYAEIEQVRQSAWQKQEGGSHYKKLAIQPMEYALKNKLDYAQANVVKYVTRHADKNGKEDLLKAIHNIELMIEHYYS